MLVAIWAQDEQGMIGQENQLPWYLPNDLKFFKQMTEDNALVMGRKTFEGMGSKPLPNRKTIVLTTDKNYRSQGVEVLHSVESVLDYARSFEGITFIAGGSVVYREFLPYCDVLYRTVIHHSFTGDTFFPDITWDEWTQINSSSGEIDEKNKYEHQFETYQRKIVAERND